MKEKQRVSAQRYPASNQPQEEAKVLCYYSEEAEVGGPSTPHHYVVLRWLKDGQIDVKKIQHADSCEEVDGITVKNQVWNVVPTKNSNGILHSDREDAIKMCQHFNRQFDNLVKTGLWSQEDAWGWGGCELEFEVKEVWE
jgi:hypothetical protein